MNEVVDSAWDARFLMPFLWAPFIIIKLPTRYFYTTSGNGMYRNCVALAVYSNSQATINGHCASELLQSNPTIYLKIYKLIHSCYISPR